MKLYHYTLGQNIDSIFNDGALKSSFMQSGKGSVDFVWLSTNSIFEVSSRSMKQSMLSLSEIINTCGGLYRFVFDGNSECFHSWLKIQSEHGVSRGVVSLINHCAKVSGANAGQWYAYLEGALPIEGVAVEVCRSLGAGGTPVWEELDVVSH